MHAPDQPSLADVARHLDTVLRTNDVPDYPGAMNGVQVEHDGPVKRCLALAPLEIGPRLASLSGGKSVQPLGAGARHPTLAGSETIEAEARGDRIEPGRQSACGWLVPCECPPGAQQAVLRRLFGPRRFTQHRQAQPVDLR